MKTFFFLLENRRKRIVAFTNQWKCVVMEDEVIEMKLKIKEYRLKYHLTQEQLAEKMNVTRQAVTRWENNTVEPSTENLLLLAKIFDCRVDDLFYDPEKSENETEKKPFWTIDKENVFLFIFSVFFFLFYFLYQEKIGYYSMTFFFVISVIIFSFFTFFTAIINHKDLKDKKTFFALMIPPLLILLLEAIVGFLVEYK